MMAHQDAAVASAETLAVAMPLEAAVQVRQVALEIATPKTSKKARQNKARTRSRKAKARPSKAAKVRTAPRTEARTINAALAKLSEAQTVVTVEKPVTSVKVESVASTPIAQDMSTSQLPDASKARSPKNLPDSSQASASGGRLSSSNQNPIKNARRKAFSQNRRPSAYRMAR